MLFSCCFHAESEHATLEQHDIDSCIAFIADLTHPKNFGQFWPLDALQAVPILNMSVSDANKVCFPDPFFNRAIMYFVRFDFTTNS